MILNRIIVQFSTILCLTISSISCGFNNEFPLSQLVELGEDNWHAMLKGEWMVEFYAPWCPACKSLAPTWEKFAISAGRHNLHVAKIDVTKSPSLSGRFFVTALPTIYHVINGEFRQYRGPRSGDSLIEYVKERQWQKVEPLSAWKQPNSVHMSILSWFFKLSHYLKDVNTRLHEEYGLPTWGSYVLFAIATIFIGAVLGLFLVCVVDFLYPPKKIHRQSFSSSTRDDEKEGNENSAGIEDIPGDELEDEDDDNDVGDDDEDADNNDAGRRQRQDNDEPEIDDSTSEGEKNSDEDSDEGDYDVLENVPESGKKKKSSSNKSDVGADGDKEKSKKDDENIVDNKNDNSSNSEIRERKPAAATKKDETN